jgi:hypothetical protein
LGPPVCAEGKVMGRLTIDEIAELDTLSRERELTLQESLRLELLIARQHGKRRSYGLTKEMARARLKRSGNPTERPVP